MAALALEVGHSEAEGREGGSVGLVNRFTQTEIAQLENSFKQLEIDLKRQFASDVNDCREGMEEAQARAEKELNLRVEHYHSENRTRLQQIDHTGNNTAQDVKDLSHKFDGLCQQLKDNQLAAAVDHVKVESLYGPSGGVAVLNQRLTDARALSDQRLEKVTSSIDELKGWVKWGGGVIATISFLMAAAGLLWNITHHH